MKKGIFVGIFALLFMRSGFYLLAQEGTGASVAKTRKYAYKKAGEWLFEGLQTVALPRTRPLTREEDLFQVPVDWDRQARETHVAFPLINVSAIDYGGHAKNATAYFSGFETKYHSEGPKLFGEYFFRVEHNPRFSEKQKEDVKANSALMRERSMV